MCASVLPEGRHKNSQELGRSQSPTRYCKWSVSLKGERKNKLPKQRGFWIPTADRENRILCFHQTLLQGNVSMIMFSTSFFIYIHTYVYIYAHIHIYKYNVITTVWGDAESHKWEKDTKVLIRETKSSFPVEIHSKYTNVDSILSSIFGTEDGISLQNLVRLQ